MSFLLRWGMIGLGGFMVVGGLNEALTGGGVNETAQKVSASELVSSAGSVERQFVEVSGQLETDSAVYETGLAEPSMTRMPTDEVYALPDPSGGNWASSARPFTGSTVSFQGELAPIRVIVEEIWVEQGESMQDGELSAIRCIATAMTGMGRLLVVSPRFESEDDPAYLTWLQSTSFWGKLCSATSLDDNLNLKRDSNEVFDLYRGAGVPLNPSESFVLLTRGGQATPFNGAAYVPVEGTGNTVLVRFHAQDHDRLGGVFSGVTEQAYSSFLGGSGAGAEALIPGLPNRLVLIDTSTTGADVNRGAMAGGVFGVVLGLGSIALGGAWVMAIRAARRRHERVTQEQLDQALGVMIAAQGSSPSENRYAA